MYWRVSFEKFTALDKDRRIWWGRKGGNVPRIKRFLSEVMEGIVPQSIWPHDEVGHTQEAKKEVMAVVPGSEDVFQTPKPERLMSWEFPRLCRGGSRSLTFTEENSSASDYQAEFG
jgi:adenine-specific DNA-methyltransferase